MVARFLKIDKQTRGYWSCVVPGQNRNVCESVLDMLILSVSESACHSSHAALRQDSQARGKSLNKGEKVGCYIICGMSDENFQARSDSNLGSHGAQPEAEKQVFYFNAGSMTYQNKDLPVLEEIKQAKWDWSIMRKIEKLTMDYMDLPDQVEKIQQCAETLRTIQLHHTRS
jgi:hypothetical protein